MVRVRTIEVLGTPIRVNETNATCWSPTTGHEDFWTAFERDAYEPGTVKRMRRLLLKPGNLFIDIGAWIGPFTLLALALGCKVVAFEPDPVAFAALQANTELNGGDLILFNAAVVPEGAGPYALGHGDGQGLSTLERYVPGAQLVPTMTLGRLFRLLEDWSVGFPSKPSFVKVDVEGYEHTLMPALGPWLAKLKVPAQVSLHGARFNPRSVSGFTTVIWPESNSGDVVLLPFTSMDPKQWT